MLRGTTFFLGHLVGAASLSGVLLCAPATACDLSEPETGTVASVVDGETLTLGDGRVVRLIGAKAPPARLAGRGSLAARRRGEGGIV
jgi:endonuclease YncB( thermonuclease family)